MKKKKKKEEQEEPNKTKHSVWFWQHWQLEELDPSGYFSFIDKWRGFKRDWGNIDLFFFRK